MFPLPVAPLLDRGLARLGSQLRLWEPTPLWLPQLYTICFLNITKVLLSVYWGLKKNHCFGLHAYHFV